ncbi:MAG: hypothetical protein ABEI52_09125 [Halobacteriaceae archaeon]
MSKEVTWSETRKVAVRASLFLQTVLNHPSSAESVNLEIDDPLFFFHSGKSSGATAEALSRCFGQQILQGFRRHDDALLRKAVE